MSQLSELGRLLWGWARANVTVLLCLLVIMVGLPVALFLSMRAAQSQQVAIVEDISSQRGALQRLDVTYEVEPVSPDEPSEGFSRAPNIATTEAMGAALRARRSVVDELRAVVIERNRHGKAEASASGAVGGLLVAGLLPEPVPASESVLKRYDAAEAWPVAHEALLRAAEAGPPLGVEDVAGRLQGFELRIRGSQLGGRGEGASLTPEERAELLGQLQRQRLLLYERAAERLTFYADGTSFPEARPLENAVEVPSMARVWDWQWRHWVHADVVGALVGANTEASTGRLLRVPEAPVKRLLRCVVEALPLEPAAQADKVPRGRRGRGGSGEAVQPVPASPTTAVPVEYAASPTGRTGWPVRPHGMYDVRYVDVVLVVDSVRVPEVLSAIESTNLMTVVGMRLSARDALADLRSGHFYGSSPVVEAHLRIETLWLRDWTAKWMPASVRAVMGVPDSQAGAAALASPGDGA